MSDSLFKPIQCPLCNSSAWTVVQPSTFPDNAGSNLAQLFRYEELAMAKETTVCGQIVRCQGCDLIYMNPQFAGFGQLYQDAKDDYYIYTAPGRLQTFQRDVRQIARRMESRGTLLDVGCSTGLFLEAATADGWTAHGIELSRWALDMAKEKGFVVYDRLLNELKLPDESYDVVTMFGVIEHCPDPLAVLREVRRILKKDGLLVMTMPYHNRLATRIMRRQFYLLQHLVYFSPKTMPVALAKAGFSRWDIKYYFRVMSLRNLLRWFHGTSRLKLVRAIFDNPLLGWIPAANLADEYVCYVRK